jgi:hypothetical protein
VSWWRVARNVALVVLCGALLLVPPSVQINGTKDLVSCRPLGLEWRDSVSLNREVTNAQVDAINRYLAASSVADAAEASTILVAACRDARQDRQTLIIVVGFVIIGWLVVRRRPRTDEDVQAAVAQAGAEE